MNDQTNIEWGRICLQQRGYALQHAPQIVIETPWSMVCKYVTSVGNFYLKQTPPLLFKEAQIIETLSKQFHINVARIVAVNHAQYCFLMADAGETLRLYLKKEFQPELMLRAMTSFAKMQRKTEKDLETFLHMDVPDWRLEKIPTLIEDLIRDTSLLKAEGMTEDEIQSLPHLIPSLTKQCEDLAQLHIPESIVQPDFNTNNILYDANIDKLTMIDLGEISISHPFFPLHNFLHQAQIHHNINPLHAAYSQLQETCLRLWSDLFDRNKLVQAFALSQKLWPIYAVLAMHRLIVSVGLPAFQAYYAHKKSNHLAWHFRAYCSIQTD